MRHRFQPMRSILAVFCSSLAVTLLGASPTLFGTPTVVIFPLRAASGVDANAGLGYANRLGSALTALGGVKVVMGDPATPAAEYLHVAKAAGANFYLMGSIAPPIKDAVAVVEQMVSTRTGIVSWSNTAYVNSDDDVAAQAPIIKNAVTAYETRGFVTILHPTPPPAPAQTAPPAPPKKTATAARSGATSGDQPPQQLPNEAYGFSSKPTAPPKAYASANTPSRFVVLTFAGDTVTPEVRDYTADALVSALKRHGQSAAEGNPDTTGHRLPSADLCSSTGARYLVFGSVSGSSVRASEATNYEAHSDASIKLATYDCTSERFLASAKQANGRGGRWTQAVDNAADAAVRNYLLKVTTVAASS